MKELFQIDESGEQAIGTGRPADRQAAAASPLDPRTLLAGLRHRWWTGLLVAPIVAGVGLWASKVRVTPNYAAEALLTVQPTVPSVAVTDEQWRAQSIHGFYDDYTRTLVELIKTRAVLENVVGDLDEAGVRWVPPSVEPERVVDHLRSRLEIRAVRDTHLLAIRFVDAESTVVAPIVNATAAAVLEHVEERELEEKHKRESALLEELGRVEQELTDTYAELDRLTPKLGSALLDERQNPFYERVNTLEEGLTKVLVQRAAAEGALELARTEAARLCSAVPEADVLAAVEDDVAVRDARVMLGRLQRDEEASTGHLSEQHPDRQRSLHRLELARERVATLEVEAAARARARLTAERTERAEDLVAEAEGAAQAARTSASEMTAVLTQARADLSDHGRAMFDGSLLRDRADRLLTVIGLLESRLEEVRIESRADARVALASAGVLPSGPDSDKSKLVLLAAVGVAGALLLGLPMLLELLFPRLRRLEDLTRGRLAALAPWDEAVARLGARARATGPHAIGGLTIVPSDADSRAAARSLADGLAASLEIEPRELVAAASDPRQGTWVLLADVPDAGVAELCAASGLPAVVVTRQGGSPRAAARVVRALTERGVSCLGGLFDPLPTKA